MLKGELDAFDVVIGQAKRQKRDMKDRQSMVEYIEEQKKRGVNAPKDESEAEDELKQSQY